MEHTDTKDQVFIHKYKHFVPEVVILCFAAVLLFSGLSNPFLWQDEAETALLGKNILEYGIPKAYDGKNIISQQVGKEFDETFLWRWSSWGDKYVAALSMWIFGKTTFGTRFLFVVFGFASVIFFYLTVKRIFPSLFMQRLTIIFYVTSIAFLLSARQCRYYSLVLFFSVLMIFFLYRNARKTWHWFGFIGASFFLFHSNYFLALAVFLSFLSTLVIARLTQGIKIKEYFIGIASAMVVSLPGLFLYNSWHTVEQADNSSFFKNLSYYFIQINDYLYPFVIFLTVCVYFIFLRKRQADNLQDWVPNVSLYLWSLVFIAIYIILISTVGGNFFRYLLPLLPLFIILMSYSLFLIFRERKILIVLISAIVILSNFFHAIPKAVFGLSEENEKLKSYIFAYVYELTHDRKGPNRALVEFLQHNADPDDVVLITYGDLPLMFYTDLEVHGGHAGLDFERLQLNRIQWLIIRYNIVSTMPGKDGSVLQFMVNSLNLEDFYPIVLNAKDTTFEHREDPNDLYFFKNRKDLQNIVIHKRR